MVHKVGIDMISLLLENGADVNAQDIMGNTPLHHAMVHKVGIDMISLLLENGADVNAQDIIGNTPLLRRLRHHSGDNSTPDVVQLLLEEGTDPNIPNQFGEVPLETAMSECKGSQRRAIVLTLLEHGAQVNQPGSYNRTALHRVCRRLDFDKHMIEDIRLIFDLAIFGFLF
jgi:ankyrin repeat protein